MKSPIFVAFGTAVFAGAVSACIGVWIAATYYRSLPPSPDFGGLKEAIIGVLNASVAAALLGGVSFFLGALFHLGAFGSVSSKKIAIAFIILLGVLAFMGYAVCFLSLLAF